MGDRFELFVMSVTRAYKYISQIKKHESAHFDIKGIHVMCMIFLGKHKEGLTAAELTALCCEDKAAISRTVDSLAEKGYVVYSESDPKRRWRSKIMLTEEGRELTLRMSELIEDIVKTISDGLSIEDELRFYRVFNHINDKLADYFEGIGGKRSV